MTNVSDATVHTDLTIGALLQSGLLAGRNQEIVYRDEMRMTYRALGDRVNRLASGLACCGVRLGDVVAVLDWDTHRYLECYFAVPMMGAILQTVNLRMAAEQIVFCLAGTQASVLLVNRDFLPFIAGVRADLPDVKHVIAMEEAAPAGHEWLAYEALLRDAPAFDFPVLPEDSLATTFHTTGTTGSPKRVAFTHRQIVLHTLMFAGLFANQPVGQGFRRSDIYMPLTPLFHVHAWGLPYLATMLGTKQVYPGRYEPDMLLRLHHDEGVSFSHCVPAVLQMVLDAAEARPDSPIGRWTIVIGGSALPSSLQEKAAKAGVSTLVGFGMSETLPFCLSRASDGGDGQDAAEQELLRAAGYPAPLAEVSIVDDQMNHVAQDGAAQGELVVRAPWLTASYVGDEAATEELWRGGWLHTQDVATIDPDGVVRIRDRIKDVIKSGGEWISSQQLEELITRHAAIGDAAVIGIPDERWGERPFAFIVSADPEGEPLTTADVADHLKQFVTAGNLSGFAVPRQLLVLDQLPRTSVGKHDKKRLRQIYAAGRQQR